MKFLKSIRAWYRNTFFDVGYSDYKRETMSGEYGDYVESEKVESTILELVKDPTLEIRKISSPIPAYQFSIKTSSTDRRPFLVMKIYDGIILGKVDRIMYIKCGSDNENEVPVLLQKKTVKKLSRLACREIPNHNKSEKGADEILEDLAEILMDKAGL